MEVYYNAKDDRFIVVLANDYIMTVNNAWEMYSTKDELSASILRGPNRTQLGWVLL